MYEIQTDVVIVGGGPAGLSAAVAAKKEGAEKVLIIERDEKLGGILQQCIHNGFGLHTFKEELTGPEYAGHFKEEALALGAEVLLNSMVLEVIPEESAVICVNSEYGMTKVKAGSIVLAMGCRERTRAGIMIPETEEFIPCDTLLLSVGLIPENELSRGADVKISRITNGPEVNQYMQTSWDNVFACGNVVHVNDLVDNVTVESMNAGASAARYAMHKLPEANREVPSVTGENVRYLCPQRVKIGEENETVRLFFRVLHPELDVVIRVKSGDKVLSEKKEKRVNPGEMCHVEVKTAEITGDDVTVEVVK